MQNFIKVNDNIYFFYLEDFSNAESFSLALLEFLGNYGKLNKSVHKNCDIYRLEFNYSLFTIEVIFLFPYVDKTTNFHLIYHTCNKYSFDLDDEWFFSIKRI